MAKQAKRKKRARLPYDERSDEEKLRANWKKTLGLFRRGEFSVAVIRAGTTLEIAANIVIRSELVQGAGLSQDFVDNMLKWANGLAGKMTKIIKPAVTGGPHEQAVRELTNDIAYVNRQRNDVAHSGQFRTKSSARRVLQRAHAAAIGLVRLYDPDFDLDPPE